MSEGKKEVPEFFVFDRIDELETVTLELMERADLEKPSLEAAIKLAQHASSVAEYGLILAFRGVVNQTKKKSDARVIKDLLFEGLRKGPVIAERVDAMERVLSEDVG